MTTIDTIPFSQRLTIANDVIFRELDGETVLLNLDNESYFGLDEIGTRMWRLLTEGASIQQAYDRLLDEYEVEPEQLQSDLLDLIHQLIDSGLATQADERT